MTLLGLEIVGVVIGVVDVVLPFAGKKLGRHTKTEAIKRGNDYLAHTVTLLLEIKGAVQKEENSAIQIEYEG